MCHLLYILVVIVGVIEQAKESLQEHVRFPFYFDIKIFLFVPS